jgi:hypothetical protein
VDIGCGFEFKNGFEILGQSIFKNSGPFFELTIFIQNENKITQFKTFF